ncbi:hypothetical protein [Brunnivagina elsteri]|uniref:hypothetical protein n=1 Tax=Brunnivagina elsteri TaxID=1247191 RepID=UPI001B80A0EF|nr:hypothetical protein [Calothrix elsteri]
MNFWFVRAIAMVQSTHQKAILQRRRYAMVQSTRFTAIAKSFPWQGGIVKRSAKLLVSFLLILSLSGCGGKVVSQEPFTSGKVRDNPQLTNQISEVSPPSVIQELKRSLETNQPQVKIISPKPDETLQNDRVDVSFQVKDLPIFQDSQYKLGPHLHVILDNQPYIAVYDISQPLTLSNLAAGTHTLRVFASRPWHESFKNEGAYTQTTFHVFTKTDENNPDISQPLLTYSRPKGEYGAEPILLDFYITNAPLQIGGKDILKDEIGDWRIRCTINGESFVLDRWESVYLKGFKPGKNWVKLEFLDGEGKVVKNVFNTTVRSIDYEPKGKDTLSKIIRGELSSEQVRGIVDPNYTAKIPVIEPIPTVTPKIEPTVESTPETQPKEENSKVPKIDIPEIDIPEIQVPVETPKVKLQQPERLKSGGFFKRETNKNPVPQPRLKEIPEPISTETPTIPELIPEIINETSTSETTKPPTEIPRFGKYFKYPPVNESVDKAANPSIITPSSTPLLESTKSPIPEVINPPVAIPRNKLSKQPETPNVIESSAVKGTSEPTQPAKSRFSKYLQNPQVTPTTKPEVRDIPEEKQSSSSSKTQVEVTPSNKSNALQEKFVSELEKIKSSKFLQRLQLPKPVSSSDTKVLVTDKSSTSDVQSNGES